jgi:hypothetical protein
VRRLALQPPTVLQIQESLATPFHGDGVFELTRLDGRLPYLKLYFQSQDCPRQMWALPDLGPNLLGHAGILKFSPFFVVNATSSFSHPDRLEWPENIVREHEKPLDTELAVADRHRHVLPNIFRDSESHHVSHFTVAANSLPDNRGCREEEVASRHIFDLLWEKYLQHQVGILSQLYNALSNNPAIANSAGWVFKHRMHQRLRRRQTIPIPALPRSPRSPPPLLWSTRSVRRVF